MSERFADLASRHFDGTLSPEEERELARLLAGSPEARAEFRQLARLEGAAAFLGSAGVLATKERPRRREPTRPWWPALAAAAVLALGLILGLQYVHSGPPPVVRIADCAAGDEIVRGGVPEAAVSGSALRAGDGLRSRRSLTITWDDGTRVVLAPGAEATIARDRGGKRVELGAGSLRASIAHQPAGEPMEFATALATATVVGTKLRLATTTAATRLDVDEGTVRLAAKGTEVAVVAGRSAIADAAGARFAPVRVTTVEELERAVATAGDGTSILVAAGEYRLRQPLVLGGGVRGVSIRGDGPATSVRITGGGTVPILIELGGSIDASVSDLSLADAEQHLVLCHGADGCVRPHLARLNLQDAAANTLRVLGSAVGKDTGGTIEDCEFATTRPVGDGFVAYVDLDAASGWRVAGCRFGAMQASSTVASGVLARDGAADTVCERNVFVDCRRGVTFGAGPHGVQPDHRGGVIRGNMIVRHAGVVGDAGISLNDSPRTRVERNTVLLQGTYPDAIEWRFEPCVEVTIANNLVDAALTPRDGARATLDGNVLDAQAAWFVDADQGDLHLRDRRVAPAAGADQR